MTKLTPRDIVKPNTMAYIKNGGWTCFFLKDTITGEILKVVQGRIDSVVTEKTYEETLTNCELEITPLIHHPKAYNSLKELDVCKYIGYVWRLISPISSNEIVIADNHLFKVVSDDIVISTEKNR